MGFTSKKMPNNNLKIFVKKVFNSFVDTSIQNTNFTLFSNPWKYLKKVHSEKVTCQKLLQMSSIEVPVTFLLANFSHFSHRFEISVKFCFETHI
jgi:hypothetical protein